MNCCTNCFNDEELIGFILSSSTDRGVCDFCMADDVPVIDARELDEMFQPIAALFKTVEELGITVTKKQFLHEKVQSIWGIFRLPEPGQQSLLAAILADGPLAGESILDEAVEIEAVFSPAFTGEVHEKKWENFAEEIKYRNRFFLKETIDLDLLSQLLRNFSKSYDSGKIFYRARVSESDGIELDKMGKPPASRTTPGRANPKGIPYLYLSTKAETTIYESRSSYLDYLTIAEFRLIEPLRVVSLREVARVSPFVFGDQLRTYIVHQKYLARLEQELSRPVRRFDKELDYLPSQYLCEYVKSLGYDAIEYGSSLTEGGINLAVFNDSKLEPRSTEVFEVTNVNLTYRSFDVGSLAT